jgi:hypothetical protein
VTRPQRKTPPGGVAAFFSCSAGEKSFESPQLKHGVFFHYVLQGLSGRADADQDSRVDLDELVAFTKRQVADHVNEEFGDDQSQMPELVGKVRGAVPLVAAASRAADQRPVEPSPAAGETPGTARPRPVRPSPGVVVIGPARPAGAAPKNDKLNELSPFEHFAGIVPGRTTTREVLAMFGPPDKNAAGPAEGTEVWSWSNGVSAAVYSDGSAAVDHVFVEAPYAGAAKNGLKVGLGAVEAQKILLSQYYFTRTSPGQDGSKMQLYAPSAARRAADNLQVTTRDGKVIRLKLFQP